MAESPFGFHDRSLQCFEAPRLGDDVRKVTEFKAADPLLKAKIHLLKLIGDAWKPSLVWFESNEPRSTDCLDALEEFDDVVEKWISDPNFELLVADFDNHRGVNGNIEAFRENIRRLGAFVLEKWHVARKCDR